MSSSLDELQPNDFLQLELDEYLEKFMSSRRNDKNVTNSYFYINQFIEFVCFHKNVGSLDQLKPEDFFNEYVSHIQSLTPESDSNTAKNSLNDYFHFINSSSRTIPVFLLNL
jgi:hypothetical protein